MVLGIRFNIEVMYFILWLSSSSLWYSPWCWIGRINYLACLLEYCNQQYPPPPPHSRTHPHTHTLSHAHCLFLTLAYLQYSRGACTICQQLNSMYSLTTGLLWYMIILTLIASLPNMIMHDKNQLEINHQIIKQGWFVNYVVHHFWWLKW